MSFANRDALVETMKDWLNRVGSAKVAERCLDFIALHEAEVNRVLRVRQMIKQATASLEASQIRLPTDWQEAKQIQINVAGKPRRLEPVTMEQADQIRFDAQLVDPRFYCIIGNFLEVVPTATEATEIEMAYYAKIDPLSAGTSSNWLLAAAPDYYLYGSLVHSAPYLRDDERVAMWATAMQNAKDGLENADQRAVHSGGRLKTRARLRC